MFEVDFVCGAMILSPDPVRMNPAREQIIREFVDGPDGKQCNAIIGYDRAGELASIDLFAGDALQREAFKQTLTKQVLN